MSSPRWDQHNGYVSPKGCDTPVMPNAALTLPEVAAIRAIVIGIMGCQWFPWKTSDWYWITQKLWEMENENARTMES
jgi:hypothetical protein